MINLAIKTGLKYFHHYMTPSLGNTEKPRLAFLGPLGTYSHQVTVPKLQLFYNLLTIHTGGF